MAEADEKYNASATDGRGGLVPNYLAVWPEGPGTMSYKIGTKNGVNRALVDNLDSNFEWSQDVKSGDAVEDLAP